MTDHTTTPDTSVIHPALCPTCGTPADRESHKPSSITGVLVSLYACPAAHIWRTTWTQTTAWTQVD